MIKIISGLSASLILLFSSTPLLADVKVPDELDSTIFSGDALTPCVASLGVSADGVVYAGVDQIGSLGKGPGKGRIIRLVDTDHDGIADAHTVFATIDNPRGIIPMGSKVYVLHSAWKEGEAAKYVAAYLSVLEDKDGDGVADGPPKHLVKNISTHKFNESRGVDHSTNGIRMGIDGWIYIAVGDFGFSKATGSDGRSLTCYGGGVLRVRPDGSEMEMYVHGLRNIYDVSIDPFMNLFTRGNTNDGGGWNVRFIHEIQSGEYGYPVLFKRYTREILPALVDVGGGSGTGSLYFAEPGWPEKYSNVPMMCDWGRSKLIIHRITPNGASFTQEAEEFIDCKKICDVDVDASGRLYLGAFTSGYKGGKNGFVARVTPKGWSYVAAPNLSKASPADLVSCLKSPSAKLRLAAQQALLNHPDGKTVYTKVSSLITDKSLPLENRVAALFTAKQLMGEASHPDMVMFVQDPAIREWAVRALCDRTSQLGNVKKESLIGSLQDKNPRVQVAAAVALGRLGDKTAAPALLAVATPAWEKESMENAPLIKTNGKKMVIPEGPHAQPNADIVLPHIAVKALSSLQAGEACLQAIDGSSYQGALWALQYMYTPEVVDGLISKLNSKLDTDRKQAIARTLTRLVHHEKPYEGDTWWGTRPDTRGPFYYPTPWEQTDKIKQALLDASESGDPELSKAIAFYVTKDRADIEGLTIQEADDSSESEEPKVDLDQIKNQKGQIGKMALEDIIIALGKVKGNPAKGKQLFTQQGCIACHTLTENEAPKGPYMGQIGAIMDREKIITSIIRPNQEISQGFKTSQFTMKDGTAHVGFVSKRLSDKIEIRSITGTVTSIDPNKVKDETLLPNSMMPEGLANGMSVQDFASLVSFLEQQKK
jgi:putative heme-binding domain-containing protein